MIRKLLPVLLILALGISACNFDIDTITTFETGPTVVDQISVPIPSDYSGRANLTLEFGAGKLNIQPGASGLVSGTATYNVADFEPTVTVNGATVRIEQGNWKMTGIPDLTDIKNEWDLSLGNVPLDLTIKAGAYHADYQFGGLALTNLTIKDGASEVELDFSSPNATEMNLLRYETGASNVSLTGLGNANFSSLEFDCGAGNYTLDFSGALKRNANVHVNTGISNMTLVIPNGLPAQITVEGGLSNVTRDSNWNRNGNVYTQEGSGPQLTIVVEIGAGNLTLTH